MEKSKTIKFGLHDFNRGSYNRPILVSYDYDAIIVFENIRFEDYDKFKSATECQGKNFNFCFEGFLAAANTCGQNGVLVMTSSSIPRG